MFARDWSKRAPTNNRQSMMTVLRILMRDPSLQKTFVKTLSGLQTLCSELKRHTDIYYQECEDDLATARILIEMTSK